MKEREVVDVAFAVEEEGLIVAVMPGYAGTVNRPDTCTCYAHMGQHSSCHIDYIMEKCVGASPDEYADLLRELTGPIGYDVKVISIDDVKSGEYTKQRERQVYNV